MVEDRGVPSGRDPSEPCVAIASVSRVLGCKRLRGSRVCMAVCIAVMCGTSGCGPIALYLRSPASGKVFQRAETLESVPTGAPSDPVADVEFPPGCYVSEVHAPRGSDASLFKGLKVSESVAFGSARVKLDLDVPDDYEHRFTMGAYARRKGDTLVVDILSVTYGRYRWYGNVYHHRVLIDVPSGQSAYTRTRLGWQLCAPMAGGRFRPDGRFEVVVHQEAIRGLFFFPIPLGTMEKTSLLVEKQLPFGVDNRAPLPGPQD